MMFTTRVKRSLFKVRTHTYYLGKDLKTKDVNDSNIKFMKRGHHVLSKVRNIDGSNNDPDFDHMCNTLNMYITSCGNNIIPVTINTERFVCTIKNNYFVLHDKINSNDDDILIIINSLAIINNIKNVINSQNLGLCPASLGTMRVLFNELGSNFKELSHVCHIKEECELINYHYDDNCASFRLSNHKSVKMCVNDGIGLINVVNVKQNHLCEGNMNMIMYYVVSSVAHLIYYIKCGLLVVIIFGLVGCGSLVIAQIVGLCKMLFGG